MEHMADGYVLLLFWWKLLLHARLARVACHHWSDRLLLFMQIGKTNAHLARLIYEFSILGKYFRTRRL
jgi:hypothetical protein